MKKVIRIVHTISIIILLTLTFLIFLQVIMRNFFHHGFVWTEEMARFLLLSFVLLMMPVVFYEEGNVRLDIFIQYFPRWLKKIHRIIVLLLMICFFVAYVISHIQLMSTMGDITSPSLGIPNNLFFLSALIGASLSIVVGVYKLIESFKGRKS